MINKNQIENINTQNDEKNNENINMKLLRTIIGNQIEIVNENKDMKNDKNIKDINDKKINNKKNMK